MSEVQTRPLAPRGRSSARGGRGGPRGGGRGGSRHVNGDHKVSPDISTSADQGELGELKQQYGSNLPTLKEMFPAWTDVDLLLAIQETNGDLTDTIERITQGTVSQFAEVSKKSKDRARSKVKDSGPSATDDASTVTRPARGRGGADGTRGGRGRPDRGRGGFRNVPRGAWQVAINGSRPTDSAMVEPTTESSAWDSVPSAGKENAPFESANGGWGSEPTAAKTAMPPPDVKSSLIPEGGVKKTWASMFAPKPKPVAAPAPKVDIKAPPIEEPAIPETVEPVQALPDESSVTTEATAPIEVSTEDTGVALSPSKDELTEDNVEHLPDDSTNRIVTETTASQVGSNRDIGSATPSLATTQAPAPIGRPNPLGGYAASALKATSGAGRSTSFPRRVLEQQEAVVMPSNDSHHKATVQFGMMGLNGDPIDVDEEREEAETRPQAPPQSPPTQPRAALPPAHRQVPTDSAPEALPTPRLSHGLPPAPTQHQQHSPSTGLGALSHPIGQNSQAYNQFSRYGQPLQAETAAPPQKSYDAFGQQASASPLDAYGAHPQSAAHQQHGGQSSAPTDYSQYYTAEQRNAAYQQYYNNPYGHHSAPNQQDVGNGQQRINNGFGAASGDSGYPTGSQPQQATAPSRFSDPQGSGQNTPNPAVGGAGQAHSQQGGQQHQQQPQPNQGYQYGQHPYYNSPYYASYVHQYQYNNQGGYGGPYGGNKGAMYNQHHLGYGASPQQSSYEQHSSSPANTSGFGQTSGQRDGGIGNGASGLGDFGRSGSAQPAQGQQQHSSGGGGGFGGMGEMFGRVQSGYGGGNQGYAQQQGGNDEGMKSYNESKANAGPTPSSLSQPGRPGSATNTSAGQGQSGLPPPQSHHQGFGAYPNNFGGQGSHYAGGLGGLGNQGGAQNQQGGFGGGYGGYGNQYGSYQRGGGGSGGWGTNYGNNH